MCACLFLKYRLTQPLQLSRNNSWLTVVCCAGLELSEQTQLMLLQRQIRALTRLEQTIEEGFRKEHLLRLTLDPDLVAKPNW